MTLDGLQQAVERMYQERGYTLDLMALGLGLCKEAGDVAGAINGTNPRYSRGEGHAQDTLRHELQDTLVYLCAIANGAGIFLSDCLPDDLRG